MRMLKLPPNTRWAIAVSTLAAAAFLIRVTHSSVSSERENFAPWPSSPLVKTPEQVGIPGLKDVSFPRAGGIKVSGWYAPGRNGAVVILAHGTSADRTSMLSESRILADAGFGILAFDWPGYGASEGRIDWGPNERDALIAAIDWLIRDRGIDAGKIGGFGLSMGGYMLAQVAADDIRLQALVFSATPPEITEQTRYEHSKWGFLSEWPAILILHESGMPLDQPPPLHVIGKLSPRPVLVVGGDRDPLVSAAMVREMYESARQPKDLLIVSGGGHGDYASVAPETYRKRLVEFFNCGLLSMCSKAAFRTVTNTATPPSS